ARTELLALDVIFGERRLDAIRLAYAGWRGGRPVDARADAGLVLLLAIAATRDVLRRLVCSPVPIAIAQRAVDQRDKKGEGSGKEDDLKTHRCLPIWLVGCGAAFFAAPTIDMALRRLNARRIIS